MLKHKMDFIPYNLPSIGEEEIAEVVATLRSGWLTTGARTARFEREFAAYTGAQSALAVNSCTAGLHLALAALGVGPGDEVITSAITFCATVNAIVHVGATPVLADIDEDGNIDPVSVASRITPRTKALLPVHLGGLPCQMEEIWRLAREHGLYVVEDAAHAAGAYYNGAPVGSAQGFSDAVAFSFYATKNLTTGEGGMVTSANAELHARMRTLALHGISRDAWNRYGAHGDWRYDVTVPGFKYNLSDIQAAIGVHQLRKLDSFIQCRARQAEIYRRELADMDAVEVPCERAGRRHAWHLFAIRLRLDRAAISRADFIRELGRRNIGTSVHFIPIPLLSFFAPWQGRPENQCPRALAHYERLVSLPLYPGLTDEQIGYIVCSVKDVMAKARQSSMVAVV
jgi:dTDP-4-amino-4,6-dideoxygalactose transaminase